MPFDALEWVDELTALGITPIPKQVLSQYKRDALANMKDRRPNTAWQECYLTVDQLGHLNRLATYDLTWWRSAPRRVRRLAARVQTAIPNATFRVGYIHKDPYLIVSYHGRDACLAIWLHRFRLVAMAKTSPAVSPT